ncbi:hypothetical protein FBUS_04216 [Fasciolopsis buskii]|uniref:Uncharacterized protein n=1 Tax=Fasciolopsis buskii TaxID=27845 RepID=A0A8E0VER9_9TREM|nr:hypothetical protein FBUS_04216 [Fasciolopsis buski]
MQDFYLFLIREVLKGCSKMDLDQFDERRKGVHAFIDQAKLTPELLADNALMFLTKRTGFIYTDPLKDFPRMTIADLMAFASQLLCQLSINMYVAGEISIEDAQSMYDRTVRAIGCIPTLHKKELLFNHHLTQFLCPANSPKVNITVQLKQTFIRSNGHSAIQISIRSDETENADEHWLSRVAAFWYRIAPLLILSLPDTELENLVSSNRNSVIAQFDRNPSDLDEYMRTVWETVMKWEANFEFVEQIVQNATRMTRSDLYKFFFDNYLDLNQQRTIILEITPNRSKRVVRKGSFRRQFIQAADVLDDEISKFIVQNNIDAHAGELHGGEQFRLIDRFYPERMKTIYDLHVFRNQNHGRHKE